MPHEVPGIGGLVEFIATSLPGDVYEGRADVLMGDMLAGDLGPPDGYQGP